MYDPALVRFEFPGCFSPPLLLALAIRALIYEHTGLLLWLSELGKSSFLSRLLRKYVYTKPQSMKLETELKIH